VDRPGGRASNIEINAVLIRETNSPKVENPVEWLLLTSLPIKTFAQVCAIISYYCCRWQIEIFFRILKSGWAVFSDAPVTGCPDQKPCGSECNERLTSR